MNRSPQTHPTLEETQRFRTDPLAYFQYILAQGVPLKMNTTSERQVIDFDPPPRAGWTLASLFTHHVVEKHSVIGDVEIFDASKFHYRVHTGRHSYHDVIDFQNRLPALAELPGAPGIELVFTPPELLSDGRLDADVMRVLRTIDNDKKYIEEDTGSLLSTSCIVDVIKQLHLRIRQDRELIAQLKKD